MPAIMAVIGAAGVVYSNKALDLSRPTLAMAMGVLITPDQAIFTLVLGRLPRLTV